MMQMNFDIAESPPAQGRDLIDLPGIVLVSRVEERVLRLATDRIGQSGDRKWILAHPALDAGLLHMTRRTPPLWLEMIADGDENVAPFPGCSVSWSQQFRKAPERNPFNSHEFEFDCDFD